MDDIILLQNKFLESKAEKAELEKKVIEAIPKKNICAICNRI